MASDIDARVAARVRHSPIFDGRAYLDLYDDVRLAGMDPAEHYASFGLREGRRGTTETGVACALGRINAGFDSAAAAYLTAFERAQRETPARTRFTAERTVLVYCHSRANYYMHSIAQAIAHALSSAGVRAVLTDEREAAPDAGRLPLVVAPHEFFTHPLPPALCEAGFIGRAVMFNTEQLPSPWLAAALPWLYAARGVVDINFHSSLVWAECGIPAAHVLPAFDRDARTRALGLFDRRHPAVRWMDPAWLDVIGAIDTPADRPLDLFFTGYTTPLRTEFFVRNARYLASKQCFLAYAALPPAGTPPDALTRKLLGVNVGVSLLSKIVLNLHRYPVGYFEWERLLVQGFACGTPVVTSPCLPSPFFTPGVHYLEAPGQHLDALAAWVLDTPDGRSRADAVAAEAGRVLSAQLTPLRCGRHLTAFLADVDREAV